ncbi:Inner membrane ABC transporter permease protein YdcV [Thermoflexales bacterium]|nr:Inner membrane ABC transporter permease protein YdcV [Thermoflexales bacterium]
MSRRRSPWLTLSTILVYGFLYLPIVVLVVFAFNSSRQNVVFEGIVNRDACGPFYWFCRVFQNQDALDASVNTLKIALTSTVLSTLIGTMAALALQRHTFKLKLFAEASLYIPIVIPEIVMGIGILVLFNTVFRFVNTTFDLAPAQRLGLGLGTVIISHVAFSVPFVTLTVRTRLHSFDRAVEEAAADLGANAWTTFRRITLPLIMPGVLAGAMLAFTLSLDDFIITFFTNGPGSTTLPIYVYGLLRRTVTPEVNALSTMWILVVLAALVVSNRVQRRVA